MSSALAVLVFVLVFVFFVLSVVGSVDSSSVDEEKAGPDDVTVTVGGDFWSWSAVE